MENMKECPICNGTTKKAVEVNAPGWITIVVGYDKDTHTLPCDNCGGQYMYGRPVGKVKSRPDGTACVHNYESTKIGNCLHNYKCVHCGDEFNIDSTD